MIDATFNVKRIFVHMLLRLHFRGFRTELRTRSRTHKPTKKSKSNLVARKKNQSKNLRFPQPWDRTHRHLRQYLHALLLLLEFLTTPQDKSGRASGNSIEFSASFQLCTCPVQRIESGNGQEKHRVFRKQEIHPIFTPEFSSKSRPPSNETISLANQRKRGRNWTFHERLHGPALPKRAA